MSFLSLKYPRIPPESMNRCPPFLHSFQIISQAAIYPLMTMRGQQVLTLILLSQVKSSREVSAFVQGKLLRHIVQIPESKTAIFLVFSTRRYSGVQFNMSKKLKVSKIAFFVFVLSNSDFVVHFYSSSAAIQFYLLNNFNCAGNC